MKNDPSDPLRIPEDELVNMNDSPVTHQEMKDAVDALSKEKLINIDLNNTFEKVPIAKHIGVTEVGEETRSNFVELKDKRDQYIWKAVSKASSRHIIEQDSETMFKEVRDQLFKDHGLNPRLIRDDEEYAKKNKSAIKEINDTYPNERVKWMIQRHHDLMIDPEDLEPSI
jgi:hypothetical protein